MDALTGDIYADIGAMHHRFVQMDRGESILLQPISKARYHAVEAQMERLSVEMALLREVLLKLVEVRG